MKSRAEMEGAKPDPGTAAAKKGGCTCVFIPAQGRGPNRTAARIVWDLPSNAGGGCKFHWPPLG